MANVLEDSKVEKLSGLDWVTNWTSWFERFLTWVFSFLIAWL